MTSPFAPDPRALRERLADRRVIASVSGGKDSAALSLPLFFGAEQAHDGCMRWGLCETAASEGAGA